MNKISIPVQGNMAEINSAQEVINELTSELNAKGVIITPSIIYKLLKKVKDNPLLVKLL